MIVQEVKPKSPISFLSDEFIESLEEDEFIIKKSFNQEEENSTSKED